MLPSRWHLVSTRMKMGDLASPLSLFVGKSEDRALTPGAAQRLLGALATYAADPAALPTGCNTAPDLAGGPQDRDRSRGLLERPPRDPHSQGGVEESLCEGCRLADRRRGQRTAEPVVVMPPALPLPRSESETAAPEPEGGAHGGTRRAWSTFCPPNVECFPLSKLSLWDPSRFGCTAISFTFWAGVTNGARAVESGLVG